MLSSREAGGPTGTMRDPNSTPMVTSWCGEKRPSQRRTVSYWAVSIELWLLVGKARRLHLIYHIQSLPAIQSLLCSPMVETCGVVMPHGYACSEDRRDAELLDHEESRPEKNSAGEVFR
jgi:hypothetical protein